MEAERDAEARYSIQVDRVFLVAMPALFLGRVQLDFACNSLDRSNSTFDDDNAILVLF